PDRGGPCQSGPPGVPGGQGGPVGGGGGFPNRGQEESADDDGTSTRLQQLGDGIGPVDSAAGGHGQVHLGEDVADEVGRGTVLDGPCRVRGAGLPAGASPPDDEAVDSAYGRGVSFGC